MKRALLAAIALVGSLAPGLSADTVYLRGGGRISGVVVSRGAETIALEVGPGRITLPLSRVERVTSGPSNIAEYHERLGRLSSANLRGWLELAQWARDHELLTQAREAFEHVLELDPDNVVANEALGRVRLGDRWMSREESLRGQGLLPFEGQWMTPAEREAILRERAEVAAADRARREAEARVREAEARARAAEAEARAAEASARDRDTWFGPAFVVGPVSGSFPCHVHPCGLRPIVPAPPAPPPPPPPARPPMRDGGAHRRHGTTSS